MFFFLILGTPLMKLLVMINIDFAAKSPETIDLSDFI